MNLLGLLLEPPDIRQAPESRERRVAKEGSPYYEIRPGVIAAGGDEYINPENSLPLARKYFPLDWLEAVNNDSVNITVTINGSEVLVVPAGTIREFDQEMAIRAVNVHNDDAATSTTANLVRLNLQRKAISGNSTLRRLV